MILGIDVDSVVASLSPTWIGKYNNDWNDNLDWRNITEWTTHNFVKPECGLKIYDYLKDPSLYDSVEPIENSLEMINKLKEYGHRIVYITTTPIETPGVKFNWLVKHGFLKDNELHNYFEAKDKSLFNVDILLDDNLDTIRYFENGIGVIFDQPWNRNDHHFYRVVNWKEFFTLVNWIIFNNIERIGL